ncbi:MAG: SDR family oxidoreductase, partial [Thioalkalivibrio sp.]|nr:SDR family oxidoreductase [Thioalkalivibrio sp.]
MSESTRVHLVFGAYGGIGSALARRLAHSGVQLAVSGRDSDRLDALAVELGAWPVPADASDFDEVDEAVSRVVERFGRLDGVTNCVGSLLLKPAHLTRASEWHETLAANLTSAFAVVRASVKPMMKQKSGAIVLASTAAASHGLPNHEAIAAAKGGIDALVRSAGATYGAAGVRVNAVAPG